MHMYLEQLIMYPFFTLLAEHDDDLADTFLVSVQMFLTLYVPFHVLFQCHGLQMLVHGYSVC